MPDRGVNIREPLAALQHDIWSSWMAWVFKICPHNEDGSVTIPPELVQRWKRQIDTPYDQLSGPEQDSDREQADKVINVILEVRGEKTTL